MRLLGQTLLVIHIFAFIALVGSIFFNTLVLIPATRRIPPAHAAVVHNGIGTGLMWLGLSSLALLGITGFVLLWVYGTLGSLLDPAFWITAYGWRLAIMLVGWAGLLVTGGLSAWWSVTVMERKLPYTAGLQALEERRQAQQRISDIYEWLAWVNLGLALAATIGGTLIRALR
jgi:hypothetical protein